VCCLFLASARLCIAGDVPALKAPVFGIEQIMTPSELQETGVSRLSCQQREALNEWLLRYTIRILSAKEKVEQESSTSLQSGSTGVPSEAPASNCDPAIGSHISGDFRGWIGETSFELDNGQVWRQAERGSLYSYSYTPMVTIYNTASGCRMKVEDEEDTIIVRRIK
jgi:hypothetical protein